MEISTRGEWLKRIIICVDFIQKLYTTLSYIYCKCYPNLKYHNDESTLRPYVRMATPAVSSRFLELLQLLVKRPAIPTSATVIPN